MICMQGKGVSRGVAMGRLHFLRRERAAKRPAGQPGEELALFHRAQQEAAAQLRSLAAKGEGAARELFETHALLVFDEDFEAAVQARTAAGLCAEEAVRLAGDELAGVLRAMADAYLRERAADVMDVAGRIVRCLTGQQEDGPAPDGPVIIAADDLTPSQTAQLDRTRVLGFVTRCGSPVSHTAILARSMGIPAVCGLGDQLEEGCDGCFACMDGEEGLVVLEPDGAILADMAARQKRLRARQAEDEAVRGQPDVTADGRPLAVRCSVGAPGDAEAARQSDARGVGLLRTEFLYLASGDLPDEEAQYRAYREAVDAMGGQRVVIRTLDAGADKQLGGLTLPKEENPALGLRGTRLCLSRPDMFRTQLRAILRASAHGCVAVLLPMIASVWEVRECRRLLEAAKAELEAEGRLFDREIELGVMIETPASVLIAQELAREADFFSIGTNDLTQYLLACDRQSAELDRFCDPRHPAVLSAIRLAAQAARQAGICVSVCGELAADEAMLPFLLEAGVEEISVPPRDVLRLRRAIRRLDGNGGG